MPLELARSYNSITATSEQKGWLGAFGWGWTAPFETTLTTTPDKNVLLRDGGNGNTILFRPESEDAKAMPQFIEQLKKAYFEKEKGRQFTREEVTKFTLPEKIVFQLKNDPDFRAEMASKYGIEGKIPAGQVLVSSEFGYQTVYQKGAEWVRQRDGMTQIFDKEGRLVKQIDMNGFYLTFTYAASQRFQLEQISDANKTMSLRFRWRNERVSEISDNRGNRATYSYDSSGNLVKVTNSSSQSFRYLYENKKFPHLLTKIEYLSESALGSVAFRALRYDDNALVVYHREKDGVETTFAYGKMAKDPENNFWTKSVKTENGSKEEIYDEFLIKSRTDGTKYLARQENRMGTSATITVFTPCCGKPLEVTKNGVTTAYKYYENGLLKERIGPKEDTKIEYDPRWKKVSRVSQNGLISEYAYDDRGNLVSASNSKNERVTLKYDRFGRILEMVDSSRKAVTFRYGELGKPVLITQTGVGAVRIDYDSQGRILKADTVGDPKSRKSKEESREVVKRVMHGFQILLDIIRPAGAGVNIG